VEVRRGEERGYLNDNRRVTERQYSRACLCLRGTLVKRTRIYYSASHYVWLGDVYSFHPGMASFRS